jgi:polyisoprenyl-phosphate glycosyltransferase
MSRPDVSIVIPAKNEADNLSILVESIFVVLSHDSATKEVIIVDDGSTDETLAELRILSQRYNNVRYVSFTRNFGHQAALLAGMRHANGRCVVCMDADFQHPPSMLPEMIGAWRNGVKIVLTQRDDTGRQGRTKARASRIFYVLLRYLSDTDIRPGSADFYLLDETVLRELEQFREPALFLRGILPTLGFSTTRISYVPCERRFGRTSYSFSRMVQLAVDGVLSVSIKPLRLGVLFSVVTAMLALLYGVYVIVVFMSGQSVPGWASVALIVSTIGAMQLLVLGVIGEYIGRLLRDVRSRPPYLIHESDTTRHEHEQWPITNVTE